MKTYYAAALLAIVAGQAYADRASTTRYWDCSGGSCGCGFGDPNKPVHCHSNAMFAAPAGNEHGAKFYGGAAISQQLGGGDWLAEGCGRCFKVTGAANVAGYSGSSTVVLKGTNYCPPSNSVCAGQAHFDIAAPGFDYPNASQSNTCDAVESDGALHSPQVCGYWMIHSQDPSENCDCSAFSDPILTAGCENFKSLGWNNPDVDYEVVECPTELKEAPPCWEDNGETWPSSAPALCAAPPATWISAFAGFFN